MNARSRRLIQEMVLAIVVAVVLSFLERLLSQSAFAYRFPVELTPVLWVAFRHGSASAVITAMLAGSIAGGIQSPGFDVKILVVYWVLPLMMGGVAGFFARNVHRTLNNRRYFSVNLNIITGTLLSALLLFVLKYVLAPFATYRADLALSISSVTFWLSWLATTVLISGLLIVMARQQPNWLLPRRSKYLSTYETSSLLND